MAEAAPRPGGFTQARVLTGDVLMPPHQAGRTGRDKTDPLGQVPQGGPANTPEVGGGFRRRHCQTKSCRMRRPTKEWVFWAEGTAVDAGLETASQEPQTACWLWPWSSWLRKGRASAQ